MINFVRPGLLDLKSKFIKDRAMVRPEFRDVRTPNSLKYEAALAQLDAQVQVQCENHPWLRVGAPFARVVVRARL